MSAEHEPVIGSVHVRAGVAVAKVVGEIDVSTVVAFQHLIEEAISAGPLGIHVDLQDVEFIDGRAVTVLVRAAHRLRSTGGRMAVTGTTAWTYRIFEITGMVELLGVQAPLGAGSMFAQRIGRAAALTPARHVLDAALKLVVTMAQAVVAAADGVSITLPREGAFVTVAASDGTVLLMDHDQYETGEGPCLDAATLGVRFHVESLREEQRWSMFAPRALARGIQSILSTPLTTERGPIGALNVYSRQVGAFAEHERRWTDQFAREAAVVVASAVVENVDDTLTAQIAQALQSREVIAIAQGIVMHRDGTSRHGAEVVLRDASRRSGRPLRDVCEALVQSSVRASNQDVSDGGAHGLPPQ
jgi:anti-anti-sigma factor